MTRRQSDEEKVSIRVAGVQCEPRLMDKSRNLEMIRSRTRAAAGDGAQLVVFPECALTGYCFDSLDEARPYAEPIPGPSTESLQALCRELDVLVVMGMLEEVPGGIHNAAALVGPAGIVTGYRKVHIPCLGVDRFVLPGDQPFAVHDTHLGRVGLNICYDFVFPEAARSLALLGADMIVLPTNWPSGAEQVAAYLPTARALENRLFYIAVNRVGVEREIRFIGRSQVVDINGKTLAEADAENETILYADITPADARDKDVVFIPGKHQVNRIKDRRPELYQEIVKPHKD